METALGSARLQGPSPTALWPGLTASCRNAAEQSIYLDEDEALLKGRQQYFPFTRQLADSGLDYATFPPQSLVLCLLYQRRLDVGKQIEIPMKTRLPSTNQSC